LIEQYTFKPNPAELEPKRKEYLQNNYSVKSCSAQHNSRTARILRAPSNAASLAAELGSSRYAKASQDK